MSETENNLQSARLAQQSPKKYLFGLKQAERPQLILKKYNSILEKYRTIDCRSLSSLRLVNDELFLELKAQIEKFNQEVRDVTDKKVELPYFSWKYALYTGLKNFLRIACDTQDADMQQTFLQKISKWFQQQLQRRIRDEDETSSPQHPEKRNKSPLKPTGEFPRVILNTPYEKLSAISSTSSLNFRESVRHRDLSIQKNQLSDTKAKERSTQSSFVRLVNNERKLPTHGAKISLSQASICETTVTRLDTSYQGLGEQMYLSNSPFRSQYSGRNSRLSCMPESQNDYLLTDRSITDNYYNQVQGELLDQFLADRQELQSQDSKRGAKSEQNRSSESKVFTQDKRVGYVSLIENQLVPTVDRTANIFYRPSKEIRELTAIKDWRENQKLRLIKNREREDMHKMIDKWSHAKSRIEEELARKRESIRYGSRLECSGTVFTVKQKQLLKTPRLHDSTENKTEIRLLPRVCVTETAKEWSPQKVRLDFNEEDEDAWKESVSHQDTVTVFKESSDLTPTPEKLRISNTASTQLPATRSTTIDSHRAQESDSTEEDVNRAKLKRIRLLVGRQINHSHSILPSENKRHRLSISIFSQNKSLEGDEKRKQRHLSSFTKSIGSLSHRDDQLDEVSQVKLALEKSEVSVSVKTLTKGLISFDNSANDLMTSIPCIGSRLMDNPFLTQKRKRIKKNLKE